MFSYPILSAGGPPAVLSFGFYTDGTSTTATRDINLPSTYSAGDLLVILASFEVSSGGYQDKIQAPAGWTRVMINQDNSTLQYGAAWYKIADGTETSPTITTDVIAIGNYWVFAIKGADELDPLGPISTTPPIGLSTSGTIKGVTPDRNDSLVLGLLYHTNFASPENVTITPEGTWTQQDIEANGTGSLGLLSAVYTNEPGTAGTSSGNIDLASGTSFDAAGFMLTINTKTAAQPSYPGINILGEEWTVNETTKNVADNPVQTASIPAGVEAGDVLLAVTFYGNAFGTNPFITEDSGSWTKHQEATDSSSDASVAVFTKVSDGTETQVQFNISNNNCYAQYCVVYRLSGVNTTTPITIKNFNNSAHLYNPACPDLSPGDLWFTVRADADAPYWEDNGFEYQVGGNVRWNNFSDGIGSINSAQYVVSRAQALVAATDGEHRAVCWESRGTSAWINFKVNTS